MHWFDFFNHFKPRIEDPAYPLEMRLAGHHAGSLCLVSIGEAVHKLNLRRTGPQWAPEGESTPNEPAVLLLSPQSLICDVRELSALPGGNTEASLAKAVRERPEQLLRELHEDGRRYHLVPFGNGRQALIFSVKDSDVRKGETEITRAGLKLVQAWCGLAQAARFALKDGPARFPGAGLMLVADQTRCLEINLGDGGRPEAAALATIKGDKPDLFSPTSDLMEHLGEHPAQIVLYTTPFSVLSSATIRVPDGFTLIHQTINAHNLCFG